jgi:hypothetical protein
MMIFLMGCTPLQYVRREPVVAPAPIEAPDLTQPQLPAADCGRFLFETQWREEAWSTGSSIDVVVVGDVSPVVDARGLVACRHVVIAPGWWVQAREARDRYPLLQRQLVLWRGYSERQAERHQQESEEFARLLVIARRRQWETFAVGAGVGAGAALAVVLGVVLAGR